MTRAKRRAYSDPLLVLCPFCVHRPSKQTQLDTNRDKRIKISKSLCLFMLCYDLLGLNELREIVCEEFPHLESSPADRPNLCGRKCDGSLTDYYP